MDDNPVFEKLYKLIAETLKVQLVDCGRRNVQFYSHDYRPIWPVPVISFLETGEASSFIFRSKRTITRKAPSVSVLPAKEPYQPQIKSPEGALFFWSHIHFIIMGSVDLISLLKQPIIINESNAVNKIGVYNKELIQLSEGNKPFPPRKHTRIKSVCYDILSIILEHSEFREDAGKLFEKHQRLAPLIKEISESYKEQWTIERMLKISCLSRSRLHHVFKSVYGQTPIEYVNMIRLGEARRLLLTTKLQVSEISSRLGYEDPFYFSRCFTKMFGLSPVRYRKTET